MSRQLLSISTLQMANSYLATGTLCSSSQDLEQRVVEHVDMEALLERFDGFEECVMRMTVEGFNDRDIAREMSCSMSTVQRLRRQLRYTIALAVK